MTKVLIYDYRGAENDRQLQDLARYFAGRKWGVELARYTPQKGERGLAGLEGRLRNPNLGIEVLLVHPGAKYQSRVVKEYPIMFPELNIGLLVTGNQTPNFKVEESGRLSVLQITDLDRIAKFILGAKKVIPRS